MSILPDPLGGGLVFVHDDEDGTSMSSDLHSLIIFLGSLGKKPAKSLAYLASIISTGNGGLVPASYENISVLEQFDFAEIDREGVRIETYTAKNEFFERNISFHDSVDITAGEIRMNLEVASSSEYQSKTAHLTGGFDSRLVLAGLTATGSSDRYRFFCSGRKDSPDKSVAEKLAAEFSLTMTEHPGGRATVAPSSFKDNFLKPMQYSAGIIPGQLMGPITADIGGSIILSGGYGECLRSFYGAGGGLVGRKGAQEAARSMWGNTGFSEDASNSLLSRRLQDHLVDQLSLLIKSAKMLGIRDEAVLDYLYLNTRNRYYVGEISRLWSSDVARFDPLYTLSGPATALSMDVVSRAANVLGFDLMIKLNPHLASLPFDTPRYSDEYVALQGIPVLNDFDVRGSPKYDNRKVVAPEGSPGAAFPRATEAQVEKATKLRASVQQVAGLGVVREQCREMLQGIGRQRLEENFNYKILMRLMTAELNNRRHIRTVYNIYTSLLWYYDEPEGIRLTAR
ncbi:hypothetical protein [Arthrobacter roseus]|uniref:hypothetical protein n=1 Tax=Arthrobacter roseus TaxID=136274 RepID=UPI00196440DD|nr:hypothetical protein [Arthrobacter roseus]MBM7848885.1 hypothetical protein [Arthrobacter roseus]